MRLTTTITLLLILTASGRSFSQDKHCFDLDESRKIHELAYLERLQEKEIAELEGQKVTLQEENASIRQSMNAQIAFEREKNALLSDNVEDFKKQIASHSSETAYFKKKERKSRRERNVAIVFGALAIAAVAVK